MKYFTFLPRFHPLILAGSKRMTIRQRPKVRPGERFALRHWTGKAYRSPMGFLGTAQCLTVFKVAIEPTAVTLNNCHYQTIPDDMARLDGFADGDDMLAHFTAAHGLPFEGWATTWGDFIPAEHILIREAPTDGPLPPVAGNQVEAP